jgi:hypothetical protein
MAALASRLGINTASSPQDALAQLGDANPTLSLLAQYLGQRRVGEEQGSTTPDDGEHPQGRHDLDDAKSRSNGTSTAMRHLARKVEAIYVELQDLRVNNEALAAALGACSRCWGTDPRCAGCGGRGRPGGFPPDRELFAYFVAPAIETYERRQRAERHIAAKPASDLPEERRDA